MISRDDMSSLYTTTLGFAADLVKLMAGPKAG